MDPFRKVNQLDPPDLWERVQATSPTTGRAAWLMRGVMAALILGLLIGGIQLARSGTEPEADLTAPASSDPLDSNAGPSTPPPTSLLRTPLGVPAEVLALDPMRGTFTLYDLDSGDTLVTQRSDTDLPSGSIGGAQLTPGGDLLVTGPRGVVYVFEDADLETAPLALPPPRPGRTIPEVHAMSTANADGVWLAQPLENSTLLDLVALPGGEILRSLELDVTALPRAVSDRSVLMQSESGVVAVNSDGSVTRLGSGQLLGAGESHASILDNGTLYSAPVDGSQRKAIDRPTGNHWLGLAGPMITGYFAPLDVVSPDGKMLVAAADELDVNGDPSGWTLVEVDLRDSSATALTTLPGSLMLATWTSDGRVLLCDRERIAVLDDAGGLQTLGEPSDGSFVVSTLS